MREGGAATAECGPSIGIVSNEARPVIDLRLVPQPEAVGLARDALDDLSGTVSEASLEDARLLVSELVTNSIRHGHLATGRDHIELRADIEGDALRVEVSDPGGGFHRQPRRAASEGSGWGLYLVGRLAERWGVSSDGPTFVWFEIPVQPRAGLSSSA
jgi:anti-sigma regulatory factor (Ser/Thr protein kinase)